MPEQGSCLFYSMLDRGRDSIDKLCLDIPKFPICPALFASAPALPALAGLSYLIHHGSCQLGAFEAWGLLRCSEDSVPLSHSITSFPITSFPSEGGAILAQGKIQKNQKRV